MIFRYDSGGRNQRIFFHKNSDEARKIVVFGPCGQFLDSL